MHSALTKRLLLSSLVWVQAGLFAACTSTAPEVGRKGAAGQGTGGSAGAAPGDGGAGGSGGQGGGTGGQGGDTSSHLPPGYKRPLDLGPVGSERFPEHQKWMGDSDIWSLVPPEEMSDDYCYFFFANADKLSLPVLEWESCGEACERADLLQGLTEFASGPVLGTSRGAGETRAYLRIGQGTVVIAKDRWVLVARIIDLNSGQTVGALKLDANPDFSPCNMLRKGGRQAKPFVSELIWHRKSISDAFLTRNTISTWSTKDHRWSTRVPWTTTRQATSALPMEDNGRIFYFLPGDGIYGMITPDSMELTRLVETAKNVTFENGSSEGDLVVWPEYEHEPMQITFRVRGWAPDGKGVRTLYSDVRNWQYHETCAVVVSPTQFVGYTGSCWDSPKPAQLWKADRKGNELSNEVLGPILPDRSQVFRHMTTWGDHVSLWTGRKLFLIRLSDWKVRQLPIPEGLAEPTTTLTEDHLFVAYQTEKLVLPHPFPVTLHVTNEVYRYDLSMFDSLGVEPEE